METQINAAIALDIEHLKKIYTDGDVIAVEDVSFSVKEGEIFSFLGPNGAGKSTTISIASTALSPTSGTVKVFGFDVVKQTKEVRKHIGICPQDLVFYDNLTVYENLIFFGKMYKRPIKELKKYATFLISHVGLNEKRNTSANKLSGGMKRRLNLLIALVNDPDLIFLDEPTAGLDPQTRRLIWEFILDLKHKGKTIFLTTHYMDEADYLSDRVAIIDNGNIIALDSPFDLKREFSGGDIIEFKFNEPDKTVQAKFREYNHNSHFKEVSYIEEDNLFRIAIQNGLITIPEILKDIHEMDLHVSDMNVRANSLENVFINLTGKRLRN
ncbi:ABC transporter ATP-binding protein [Candidatus Lokiarchaeum ossiferum]|uniref:ABC transporter ATP-binding protein n=1 Tax=Candidatus Lokiarchaeum ossiferum TaxID=2951803 RepID=UPI00352C3300